jgi:DNA-binding NarL/FixJ family response regulator
MALATGYTAMTSEGEEPDTKAGFEEGWTMKLALISPPGLFADGLARLLEDLGPGMEVVQWAPDKMPNAAGRLHLVVLDLDTLGERAADAVRALHARAAAPIVAVAATLDHALMTAVLSAGARAFITKTFGREQALEVIRRALEAGPVLPREAKARRESDESRIDHSTVSTPARARSDNSYNLTPGEMRVLALLCEGHANLGIGARLGIKVGTVKIHLRSIYRKLGVQNRTQAMKIGERIETIQEMLMEHAAQGNSLRDWLVPHMTDESRRKGDVLFRRGDPGQALYYIQQGRIALREINELVGEGELLGEISIFAPEHARTCTAYCETDTKLFRLTADQAKRLYMENPQFAYHVVQLIAQRFSSDRERYMKSV